MRNNVKWVNWSKSFISTPDQLFYPVNEQEIISIINKASSENQPIKVVGSGHSCSTIAATKKGFLIDLKSYNKIINFNASEKLLTVQSGISLEKICDFVVNKNLALDNLGTIVNQSIAGAITTGTHGSGIKHGAIDQSIVAFTLLTADGKFKLFDKRLNLDEFNLAIVSLGALGIISTITIQCVENFNLKVNTKTLSFKEMLLHIDAYKKDDYMRFWWAPHTNKVQYWNATKTLETPHKSSSFTYWFQDIFKGNIVHEFGLWITSFNKKHIPKLNKFIYKLLLEKEVTNHVSNFVDGFTLPILVKQSVMEYGIPINETKVVLEKINALIIEKQFNVHMPIEVRFAPKNDAALSMAYNTETCYIGIIAYKPYGKVLDYDAYFKEVHRIFSEHNGRPHWAKVTHYSKEELVAQYPLWNNFNELRHRLDPKSIFMNDFLRRLF